MIVFFLDINCLYFGLAWGNGRVGPLWLLHLCILVNFYLNKGCLINYNKKDKNDK